MHGIRWMMILSGLALVVACASPVRYVEEPLSAPWAESATALSDIHKGVRLAAVKHGWRILEDQDSRLLLVYEKGRHFARVWVEHTVDTVSFLPDDYNIRTKKYNQWVRNLRKRVAIQLEEMSLNLDR